MSKKTITFTIKGRCDDGEVLLEDFAKFCDAVIRCLHSSETLVARTSESRIKYRLSDLRHGSATMVLTPERPSGGPDLRDSVVSHFRETISGLAAGKLSTKMNSQLLLAFSELSESLTYYKVKVGSVRLGEKFQATIKKLMSEKSIELGSVKGYLDSVSLRRGNTFFLYPLVGPAKLKCRFEPKLLDEVRNSLKYNVTVHGEMVYRGYADFPAYVNATRIEIHEGDNALPTLHQVREFGAWNTDGKSATEYVRTLRDGAETA